MSGVWKAPETGMGRTLRAPESLARSPARGHRLGGAGDHHLAGRVVVGHPDVALGPLAGRLGVVVGDAEQRGHGPGCVLAGPAHGLAPGHHQVHPVLEGDGAAGHQGRVLAEAVAGAGAPGRGRGARRRRGPPGSGTKVASWALAVAVSSSIGASSSSVARSRPAAAEASATTSQEGWSTQGAPIPERCEPCPGNVNTSTASLRLLAWSWTRPDPVGRPTAGQVCHGAFPTRRSEAALGAGLGSVGWVRVAAAQFATGLDAEANRARCVAAVRRAGDAGGGAGRAARGGHVRVRQPDHRPLRAGRAPGRPLRHRPRRRRVEPDHGGGGHVRAGRRDGRVYNTLVLVGPSGLLGAYRKVHLYDALGWCESERIAPGAPGSDNTPLAPVDGLTVGVLTCYDLRFPESARRALDAGATVLAVPAAWVAGEHKVEHWRTLLRARAIENTAYVVAAAQPGPDLQRAIAGRRPLRRGAERARAD